MSAEEFEAEVKAVLNKHFPKCEKWHMEIFKLGVLITITFDSQEVATE